jgi:DNA repair protein SbcC/Rad50
LQRFLRSVLLAQGQFAAFLKAKPDERAVLLEKITGTEVYRDLSVKAFEIFREKEQRAEQLRAVLGAVTVLEDEARGKLEADLLEARASAERLQAEQASANQQLLSQQEHARVVDELNRLSDARRLLETDLKGAAAETLVAKEGHEHFRRLRIEREPLWERAAGLNAQSDQLEEQLVQSRSGFAAWSKQQKQATSQREAAEKSLKAHLGAIEELEAWLKLNANDAEMEEALPKQRVAVREWREAFEKHHTARKHHEEAAKVQARIVLTEKSQVGWNEKATTAKSKLAEAQSESEKLSTAVDSQRSVVRHAELVAGFEEHRQDLESGKPCPLCGATEHPFAEGDGVSQLSAARGLLASLEKKLEKASGDRVALERDLAKADAEIAAEKKRLSELKAQWKELAAPSDAVLKELSEREMKARVPLGETPADAERELDALQKRAAVFSKKQQQAIAARAEQQKLEGAVLLTKQEEEAKTKRLAELQEEGKALRAKSDALKSELSELLGGRTLKEDREQYDKTMALAEKRLRLAEEQQNDLNTKSVAIAAQQEQLEVRRKPFVDQAVPSVEDLKVLSEKVKLLNEGFAAKRTELGSLDQRVKADDEARRRLEAGGKELQAAEAEALRWGRLKELIGQADGAKFAKFAQSLTLRQLINLANEHLAVLADRYRLMAAPGDGLDFRIVDLYQASVDRPMESLSGGESFLASLALALGLSALASRHHPIDSLFIDEGFGTLDSETLEVALSALENLQASGKSIGLISHVDLLKERLTTQVRVVRAAGGTSRIEVVS